MKPTRSKGNLLHELLAQAFDVKLPTTRQVAGQRYGERMARQEAARRARKPRGLIEYGIERVTPR